MESKGIVNAKTFKKNRKLILGEIRHGTKIKVSRQREKKRERDTTGLTKKRRREHFERPINMIKKFTKLMKMRERKKEINSSLENKKDVF